MKKKLQSKKAIRRVKFLEAVWLILTVIAVVTAISGFIVLICEESPDSTLSHLEFWGSKLLWTSGFGIISGITGYFATQLYSALSEFEY